jgi:hypothetical protein
MQPAGPPALECGRGKRRRERSAARRERGGAGGCEANARRAPRRGGDATGGEHARPAALATPEVLRGTGRRTERARGTSRPNTRFGCTAPHAIHDHITTTSTRCRVCRKRAIRPPHSNERTIRRLGGGTCITRCSHRQAGREAAGAAVARTHGRIPLRGRCNGRVGGEGGWDDRASPVS